MSDKTIQLHVKDEDNAAALHCDVGDYLTMDFETEYLPGVVAAEMGYGPLEAQKAQAVAARSLAYVNALLGNGAISDIGGEGQAFDAVKRDSGAYAQFHQAVADTAGIVVTYGGKPVKTHYTASNGGMTVSAKDKWGGDLLYEIAQVDPWDAAAGYAKAGHGVGLSQRGAMYAADQGKTYREILAFYYPGTALMGDYGDEELTVQDEDKFQTIVDDEENAKHDLTIYTVYQTENLCYKRAREASHIGILVHSTGAINRNLKRYVDAPDLLGKNTNNNHWNKETGLDGERWTKMVHAFIGYDISGDVCVAETLPYEYSCWGCGKGDNGSYNYDPVAHIQFEICQGSDTDETYYQKAINAAIKYCAYLCDKFGFSAEAICSHKEAAEAGYASNHGDPESWMKHFNDDMNQFRDRVAETIGEVITSNTESDNTDDVGEFTPATLKYGADGQLVKTLQNILNAWNETLSEQAFIPLVVDGKFGTKTDAAVQWYQAKHDLKVDAIVGPLTWASLLSDEEPPEEQTIALLLSGLTVEQAEEVKELAGQYSNVTVETK